MKESVVKIQSYQMALDIIEVCKRFRSEQSEYILTKQLVRCGTAPGAMVREAKYAESKKDFIHKMSIALKEANEADYWLNILHDTKYVNTTEYRDLTQKCDQVIRLLASIVKSSKASFK